VRHPAALTSLRERRPAHIAAPFFALALAFVGPATSSVASMPAAAQGSLAYVRSGDAAVVGYVGGHGQPPSVSPGKATWQMGSYWVSLPDGTHTITWDDAPQRIEPGQEYAMAFQASSDFPNGIGSRHPAEVPLLSAALVLESPLKDVSPADMKRPLAAVGGFIDAVPSATYRFRLLDESDAPAYPEVLEVEVRVSADDCATGGGCGSWVYGVRYHYIRTGSLSSPGCQAPSSGATTKIALRAGGRGTAIHAGTAPRQDEGGCPVDLSVDRIEVVQVIQNDIGDVRMVAGKKTAARVFVGYDHNPPRTITGVTVNLTATRGGQPIDGRGTPLNEPLSVPDQWQRQNTNDSLNFLLPMDWTASGTIQLVATLNVPAGLEDFNPKNDTKTSDPITFVGRNRLLIGWTPLCYVPKASPSGAPNPSGAGDQGCASGSLDSMGGVIKKLYPIADDGLTFTRLFGSGWEWHTPLDEKGVDRLRVFLRRAYLIALLLSWQFEGTLPDQLVALVPVTDQTAVLANGASDPSFLFGRTDWRTSHSAFVLDRTAAKPDEVAKTLAHEIGHNLGLRHPGTSYPGCERAEDAGTYWPPDRAGRIGVLGFDVDSGAVIPDDRPDLMAHCPPEKTWISDLSYERLFDGNMAPPKAMHTQGPLALAGTIGLADAPRQAAGDDRDWLVVTGSVARDGSSGSIDSSVAFRSGLQPAPTDEAGDHCLVIADAGGAPLAQHCFGLPFQDDDGNSLDEQAFSLAVPLPVGAATVTLVRGSAQLAATPTATGGQDLKVSLNGIAADETIRGSRTVSWATSGTSSPVSYVVSASLDGGRQWYPLTLDPSDTSATIDTSQFAGDETVTFRVSATAGLTRASAEVADVHLVGTGVKNLPPSTPGPPSGDLIRLFALIVALAAGAATFVLFMRFIAPRRG
jgi:hypothetical protein